MFFVRLSTASREFWDTKGEGRTGFLKKKLFYGHLPFSFLLSCYYDRLVPFGLGLFLGDCMMNSLKVDQQYMQIIVVCNV